MEQKIDINLMKNAEDLTCKECGGLFFEEVLRFKKISKFAIGAETDAVIPISLWRCTKCRTIPEEFLPKDMKSKKEENKGDSGIIKKI